MTIPFYETNDLIVAPATPRGRGALAIIRSSGPKCIETFARVFSHPDRLLKSEGNKILHGWFQDTEGNPIDEVLISLFRMPFSYTGQDSIEVSCHGNPVVVDRIIEILRSIGFRDSEPGEFTFRAFSSGKMDLTRAEAVNEMINARTDKGRALAASRLAGSVETVIDEAKNLVSRQAAIAALALDYPDDEMETVPFDYDSLRKMRIQLEYMVDSWKTGRLYQDGLRVALAGPANAGKSSLFNLFLKEERSIVTETPGTTRDWVEAWINLDGIPVCLVDTAGLRKQTIDPIETEGIRRTQELISASDLVIVVVDGCSSFDANESFYREEIPGCWKEQDREFLHSRIIRVWNKADKAPISPDGWLAVSALKGTGFNSLVEAVRSKILESGTFLDGGIPVIDSNRQKKLLQRAVTALKQFEEISPAPIDLKAEDLRDALDALGELTGEVSRVDILNIMFSEFCVGK